MIALPTSPAAVPVQGGAPSATSGGTDGTDPTLAGAFASLVAALLNPQLADAGVISTATATATPAAPATPTVTGISSIGAGAISLPVDTGTAIAGAPTDTTAIDPTAIDPKALNALLSAKPAEAQSPIITIAAGPETSATPVAPVPSAAVVLQARQPVAVDATTEAATPVSTIDTTEAEADTAAPVIAGPANSEARTEAETDEIDATPTTVAVDGAAHQPSTVTDVAATERTIEARPAAPVEPHQQIASVISPLRHGADGSYRLSLHLKPEHLGNVALHVDLHDGTIDLHMHTEHQHASDLLVEHLDDLRAELERGGLRAGSFDVGTNEQRRQQEEQSMRQGRLSSFASLMGADTDPEPVAPVAVAPTPTDIISDDVVDVRV